MIKKLSSTGWAFLSGLFFLFFFSCNNEKEESVSMQSISGKAQGSTFNILYFAKDDLAQKAYLSHSVDSIFALMDCLFSHWVESSAVNQLNANKKLVLINTAEAEHFNTMLVLADSVYRLSEGYFDISIYPLVKKWGFGKNIQDTSINYNDAKMAVGYDRVKWQKTSAGLHIEIGSKQALDFNSIAQGYTSDLIADYLEQNGIDSYMVEVGGELRIGNKKPNGNLWGVGIDKPVGPEEPRALIDTIYLENAALVTSGSYRKFYEKNGEKFSHSINPKTGRPVQHNLLSVSLLGQNRNCALADALATASMVMGKQQSQKMLGNLPNYDVYYIESENGAFKSQWIRK